MESTPQPPSDPADPSDPGFLADLRAAIGTWKPHPVLPLLTVTLWVVTLIKSPVILPFALIHVGWPGVQRIWYLRALNGRRITPMEGVRLWRAFFWRFALLGLVTSVPFVVLIIIVRPDVNRPQTWIAFAILSVVVDFALTFVTQALSFTTRSVREALRIGFAMIRSEWPHCAFYVLAPPLALQAVLGLRWVSSSSVVGRFVGSGFAVVLALAFKGATAAFYLRRQPCGDHGAAWQERHVRPVITEPTVAFDRPRQRSSSPRRRRPNVPEARRRRPPS